MLLMGTERTVYIRWSDKYFKKGTEKTKRRNK